MEQLELVERPCSVHIPIYWPRDEQSYKMQCVLYQSPTHPHTHSLANTYAAAPTVVSSHQHLKLQIWREGHNNTSNQLATIAECAGMASVLARKDS